MVTSCTKLNILLIIVIILIILAVVLTYLHIVDKYEKRLATIMKPFLHESYLDSTTTKAQPFVFQFPTRLDTSTPIETYKLTLALVMYSANNKIMGNKNSVPELPSYLELVDVLPYDYGVVVKPDVDLGIDDTTDANTSRANTSAYDTIIILRGTLTNKNLMSDLDWTQINYHNYGYVHEGFAKIADNLYPVIVDIIKRHHLNTNRVLIAGHSLGASVAELLSMRLQQDLSIDQLDSYLSARPNTGDYTWNNMLNSNMHLSRHFLINQSDDIPVLPLVTMTSKGVGYGFMSWPIGNDTILFNLQSGVIPTNHSPFSYYWALSNDEPTEDLMWYVPPSVACDVSDDDGIGNGSVGNDDLETQAKDNTE